MATSPLLEYFDNPATRRTVTGASWGAEVETHFVDERKRPIEAAVSTALLACRPPGPWRTTYDLGRQLIEFIAEPQPSPLALMESLEAGLDWLYRQAGRYGAYPVFGPTLPSPTKQPLLWVQDERDRIWCELDGSAPLEHLCRVASVQITVSVHPAELVPVINRLWAARLHHQDYAANDAAWRRYILASKAGYLAERYAGPTAFSGLEDYVAYLERQKVVMLRGAPCELLAANISRLTRQDLGLFVRSIWPHYRARVFDGNRGSRVSAVEVRPFSRRRDSDIAAVIAGIRGAAGI